MVGAMIRESRADPTIDYTNGISHGIYRWTQPGSWDNVVAFADKHGTNVKDLNIQLGYTDKQLAEWPYNKALLTLLTTADPVGAATETNRYFLITENPCDGHTQAVAKLVMESY
jgi:hypothetical protein